MKGSEFKLPPLDGAEDLNESETKANKLQLVLASEQGQKNARNKLFRAQQARQRFAKATMTVLNKVIEEKNEDDENDDAVETKEEKEKAKKRTRSKSISGSLWYRRNSDGTDLEQLKQMRRKKSQGMSIASVVRVAAIRKMYMSKESDDQKKKDDTTSNDEVEKESIPGKPRFVATLSPEAQFAALKAYEDMLVEKLENSYPEQKDMLYRVRTPSSKGVSLPMLVTHNFPYSKKIHHTSYNLSCYGNSNYGNNKYGNYGNSNYGNNKYGSYGNGNYGNFAKHSLVTSSMSNYSVNSEGSNATEGKLTERRLSERFQVGMDILDQIKASQGHLITSPRRIQQAAQNTIQPVPRYNKWTRKWADEFTLKDK